MQISRRTSRFQSALQAILPPASVLFVASVSPLLLTPVAVLAGVLGVWRLSADPGWTSAFFIPDGLLSRYQLWFAVAIGAQASQFILNRWVANQIADLPAPAPSDLTRPSAEVPPETLLLTTPGHLTISRHSAEGGLPSKPVHASGD